MASHLLEPRRMDIPMACSDVSKYKFPIPEHLLLLKVIEAKVVFFVQTCMERYDLTELNS